MAEWGGEAEKARWRLRTAAALLLGAFLGFLTRHFFLDDFGLNALTDAGWPRWAVVGTLGGIVVWLSGPWEIGRRGLLIGEALTFGVPGAFFIWIHQHGLASAPPSLLPKLAAAFPGAAAAPWMLLIQVYGLFIPNRAGRAATVLAVMAAVPLAIACVTAARFDEVYAVLFEQGLFSAMAVWILISAAAALYGAVRLSTLREAAREAREIGSYRLVERIGSGGMGDVYLAEHRLLRRPCAVKLIRPGLAEDDRALARFDTEVRAAARLTHPNTIEVYDFGVSEDGLFYCVMEYLPGLTLHQLVQRAGPLPPGRVVHLLAPVCGALAEAHAIGLIHRDVKPANVVAADRGGVRDVPKLLDFGLVKRINPAPLFDTPPIDAPPDGGAHHAFRNDGDGNRDGDAADAASDPQLTQLGSVVGSPLFAAPEVARGGRPTAESDLYGVGATAYFLLTGRPVFDEPSPAKALRAHAKQRPRPVHEANPAVPLDLSAVVMRCLEKNPAERFRSAAALAAALRACECAAEWSDDAARDWWAATEGVPSPRHPALLDDGRRGRASVGADDATLGDFVLQDDSVVEVDPNSRGVVVETHTPDDTAVHPAPSR
ncbi:serine/threonine-protein kinase [Alienimonas californiensis]|uniref:Serine/threonine-protein kinase PrkC n=1 Tax=Alienimonas californiensis TaxID=2527989 RepID=A0A517P8Y9_9PLAN|nr:serine/threonine-protein kinase [Alienimonas californiensis]QDT15839.1 Serine/threonine-protein kinase PrkC [Alienimonas californiensis]